MVEKMLDKVNNLAFELNNSKSTSKCLAGSLRLISDRKLDSIRLKMALGLLIIPRSRCLLLRLCFY